MSDAVISIANDLLDQARNYGGRLNTDVRERLIAVIVDPSPDTWHAAHSIVLNAGAGRLTLWQAMREVDPNCPDRGAPVPVGKTQPPPIVRWCGYTPDPMRVLAALRAAVAKAAQ